ncbi:MAG: putative N-acetyltransferase YitI [Phycisphaerae bacterium]|nr:MAG: putative N-acetyltransferase YitI [Phycisphaerae bacterium]
MIEYQEVPVDRILCLRHKLLRDGLPAESARFEADDDPQTVHWAAVVNGRVIGCVSLVLQALEGQPAWQLRGMAVLQEFQRRGIGSQLLRRTEEHVIRHAPPGLIWCNAREQAVGFYQRHGWKIISDRFDIPTAGAHYRMLKRLVPAHESYPPGNPV